MVEVVIYTDGGSRGNPREAGVEAIKVQMLKEISQNIRIQTKY